MTIYVEPSMIAADMGDLANEAVRCVDEGAEILHLDVMDGMFVPNITMGPSIVAAIRRAVGPSVRLDVHLMIYTPFEFIEPFARAGASEITFHVEATEDVEETINYIRKCNLSPGIAIRPETSETMVLNYLGLVDKVLIMTVNPGFGGQEFMDDMLNKVRFIREKCTELSIPMDIQVDGGVNHETGKKSVQAGATRLVMGTYLFSQPSMKKVIEDFK